MKITNPDSKTSISEIADGIFRISTPVLPNPGLPAGFTFYAWSFLEKKWS